MLNYPLLSEVLKDGFAVDRALNQTGEQNNEFAKEMRAMC
jgi:hypothetical protein